MYNRLQKSLTAIPADDITDVGECGLPTISVLKHTVL